MVEGQKNEERVALREDQTKKQELTSNRRLVNKFFHCQTYTISLLSAQFGIIIQMRQMSKNPFCKKLQFYSFTFVI